MNPLFVMKLKVWSEDDPKAVAQAAIFLAKKNDVYVEFKWTGNGKRRKLLVSPWDSVDSLLWELTGVTS